MPATIEAGFVKVLKVEESVGGGGGEGEEEAEAPMESVGRGGGR